MAQIAADRSLSIVVRERMDRLRSEGGARILWAVIILFGVWSVFAYTDQFVVGIIVGSIFALGAIGLTLIYGLLKIAHIAHGDMMMFTAYLSFFFLTGAVVGTRSTGDSVFPLHFGRLPGATTEIWRFSFGYGFILALIAATIIAVPLVLLIDRLVYRPLRERGASIAILAVGSLGVAIAVRGLSLMVWGPTPRKYSTGIRETIQIPGGPRIVGDQVFIVAVTALVAVATYLLLFRTRIGKAMRAMSDNPELAQISGINTEAVARWTWVVGGGLIAVAGTLLALQSQLKPELGFVLLLPIFAATILGGIGSPIGAFIGGLVVGVVSEVTVALGFISPGYKLSIAFVVLIFVILIRPRGLFGVEA